jgi:hypothetical protein
VDFDPGPDTFNLASFGTNDIFIAKFDSSGNFVWAKQMGGSSTFSSNRAMSSAVDALGNVYTTGNFEGTADFDPGPRTFNITSSGSSDIFLTKLSPPPVPILPTIIGASPTACDGDILGWRAQGVMRVDHDDSPILITELRINPGSIGNNAIEIQNLSPDTIDARGWFVVLSEGTSITNSNSSIWSLDIMQPGEVGYRTDSSSTLNSWGK